MVRVVRRADVRLVISNDYESGGRYDGTA
jgi:hypothetical protein